MNREETTTYKCEHCKDTGFCWSQRVDGTREMVLCYCHPLVQNGKAKALEGDSAIRRIVKRKRGRYKARD